jgi:hypothetical protein
VWWRIRCFAVVIEWRTASEGCTEGDGSMFIYTKAHHSSGRMTKDGQ